MREWGWVVAGVALLALELLGIDAQFYLVFLGVSAIIVGLLSLVAPELPIWSQWLAFAIFSLIALAGFRRRVYSVIRNRTGKVEERLTLGDRVMIPVRLEPGATCRVEYRGSSWSARNTAATAIDAGAEAVIAEIDGLTLHVQP
jgi:membrane protein implicated in regulation of membrane protease activity